MSTLAKHLSRSLARTLAFLACVALPFQGRAQTVRILHSWQERPAGPLAGLCKGSDGNYYGTTSSGGGADFGTVYQITPSGVLTVIHSFARSEGDTPKTSLVEGADGYFYGTTSSEGPNGVGAIFKVNAAGDFSIVVSFANTTVSQAGTMILAKDGNFYGCASSGGANGAGAIYKLTPAGQFSVFYNFTSAVGKAPFSRLVQDTDGTFYGTTPSGGAANRGTVFKVTSAGAGSALFSFGSTGGNTPPNGLVAGGDGNFYGTSNAGVFRISPGGSYTNLFTFVSATGTNPRGELALASDGMIYGTTISGGANNLGVIFRISTAGQYTKVVDFTSTIDPAQFAEIMESSPGHFIGVANEDHTNNLGCVFTATPQGALTLLKDFSPPTEMTPSGPLVEGTAGDLFGTTTNINASSGAVFKLAPGGIFSSLQSFDYVDPIGQAQGGLVLGKDKTLYGLFPFSYPNPAGGVYRIAQSGTPAVVIAAFQQGPEPNTPRGQLVQAADVNFYGVAADTQFNNPGSVFKVTRTGTVSVVHAFTGGADGSVPVGTLTLGADGKLYGATQYHSATTVDFGTLFCVTPGATPSFTTLLKFTNTNGEDPTGVLIAGPDGNIYGTTRGGGASNRGTLFKITQAGAFSLVAQFADGGPLNPQGPFVITADGNFYGVSSAGGSANLGCVYQVTPEGTVSVLASFTSPGPNTPKNGLTLGADGYLYGTTTTGGAGKLGSVFKISTAGALTHLLEFNYATGDTPAAPIFRASDNRLYGQNQKGGISGGGTIYAIDTAPFVTTLAATAISTSSAQLSASVHPNGLPTTVAWDYGQTMQYGATTSPAQDGGAGAPATISFTLTELAAHTTYHFRAEATNSLGTTPGQDLTFVTADNPPTAAADRFHPAFPGPFVLDVLANDSDVDGDTLSVSQVTNGTHGTVTTDGQHAIYTPGAGFDGNDSFTYTASDGYGGTATATVQLQNIAPVAASDLAVANSAPAQISVLPNDSDADGDFLSVLATTNGNSGTTSTDGSTVTYVPGSTYFGEDSFTYTLSDGHGGTAIAAVSVYATEPVGNIVFATGNAVPTEPAGTEFRTFGIPSINNANQTAFTATTRLSGRPSAVIFAGGVVRAHKGDAAPGIAGAHFASFKDPALNNQGEVAFIASLAGTPIAMNQALFTDAHFQIENQEPPFAEGKGLQLIAQAGVDLSELPGAFIKTFTSFVLEDDALFFTATLGGSAVHPANRFALFEWNGTRQLITRTGNSLNGKTLKSFTAINGSAGSTGQSRGAALLDGLCFRAVFSDNSVALLVFDGTNFTSVAETADPAPDMAPGTLRFLGQPIVNAGGDVAFSSTITAAPGGKGTAVFAEVDGVYHRLFGLRDPAPGLNGVLLGTSKDPVYNAGEDVVALTQLSGAGVNASNNQAIVYAPANQSPQILARLGGQPPGLPTGAQWRTFVTAVSPEGMGPMFLATMKPGDGGVDKSNLLGLWGTDSSGNLKLLFRQGQSIGNGLARSFTVLSRVGQSPDQTRSFNASRRVILRTTADHGVQSLVEIALP